MRIVDEVQKLSKPVTDKRHDLDELQVSFADRIVTKKSKLLRFTSDESFHEGPLPDALFQPRSTAEVAEIVNACSARKIPLIPYGAGTSLEGHTLAIHGGIMLDMTEMSDRRNSNNIRNKDYSNTR